MRPFLIALLALCSAAVLAEPLTGHPLIKPYKGSELKEQEGSAFEQMPLLTGKDAEGKGKLQSLEGKTTHLLYGNPEGRSFLEVSKNYEDALKAAGFDVVYACTGGKDCPEECMGYVGCSQQMWTRYVAARLKRPAQGDVWVQVLNSEQETRLSILEEKPMETGMVTIDASAMAKGIDADGHIAVYGIVFDTGKADLKPESEKQLAEIEKLLKSHPALKIHVVGHTDNVGQLSSNMDLSKRRAESVVKALTKRGIAANRLNAAGVGSLVPVATNDTEQGRARNRRVDLVKQ